jgi:hypothetical protein
MKADALTNGISAASGDSTSGGSNQQQLDPEAVSLENAHDA